MSASAPASPPPGRPSAAPRFTPAQATVIGAGALLIALALGVRQVFGLYLVPMTIEMDWSRQAFGFAMAVQNLMWGVMQPFAGALADRYGSARVIAGGAVLYALGVWGMSEAVTTSGLLLSGGLLVGIGQAGVGMSVVHGAVARIVAPERRTYALALVSTIAALGPFMFPKVTTLMMGELGWQGALLATVAVCCLMIPLAGLIRGKREVVAGVATQTSMQSLREAFGHSGFLLLVTGYFVCGFHVTFIGTHLPGFVASCDLSVAVAGTALTLIGGANLVGTYMAGVLSNRYRQKHLLSLIYLARAATIAALLVLPKTEMVMYGFATVFGLLWLSTVPLTSGLVARIFGAGHLGMLFGVVLLSHQIGSFMGAWLGGLSFDTTGSYDMVWYISIALGVAAALIHWPIRDEPVERPGAVSA